MERKNLKPVFIEHTQVLKCTSRIGIHRKINVYRNECKNNKNIHNMEQFEPHINKILVKTFK